MLRNFVNIVICFLIANIIEINAESLPDSCLKFYLESNDSTFRNVDSVMIDSSDQSLTYGQLFS